MFTVSGIKRNVKKRATVNLRTTVAELLHVGPMVKKCPTFRSTLFAFCPTLKCIVHVFSQGVVLHSRSVAMVRLNVYHKKMKLAVTRLTKEKPNAPT